MSTVNGQSPYKLYTPAVREPLPLRRKPLSLPAPPAAGDRPQKINWLQTLLPPFIMVIVLSIVASIMQTRGFIVYTMALMGIYPISRVVAYLVQKNLYEKAEAQRAAAYILELEAAEREIVTYIRKQREFLKREFLPTAGICQLAEARGDIRTLWYRTKDTVDFLALRIGIYDGKPSFSIELPKGDDIDLKDPLLSKAREIKKKYQALNQMPYLLRLKDLGSVAILCEEKYRYGLTRRLILDTLVHHRPDEVEVYVLSNHSRAARLWGWLRWTPHCKVLDANKEFDHLIFGNQAIKIFLGRLESRIDKSSHDVHRFFVVDVDGIQQFDDSFIETLISKTLEWNLSLLFIGGKQIPRSVRGVLKLKDEHTCLFVDTRIDVKDKEEKEYHTVIDLDNLPELEVCERVARSLAGIKLLSSSGDALLSPNVNLFSVLGFGKDRKLTFKDVTVNWASNGGNLKSFEDKELLQFPIGFVEKNSTLCSYSLNLLESRLGGPDAYHTMLIGTTGSGKSEFIKSLILSAAYKYPPQYLNFFCMDFKGGSTVEQLAKLPHVIGVMTNLDEVLAQRGLLAITYEIDRRQAEFQKAAKLEKREIKDIWDFNKGKPLEERMPHLILVLDEFTRGLDMLNTPEFNLQDLLEKRLVPQGRSIGIYLLLANQVVNAKVTKLLPNIGWRIALRVASTEQLQFIDSGLKPPKYPGRGYIQPIGEDPIEFQSGYSGQYVQYTDIQIKPKNISIHELLPNGSIRPFMRATQTEKNIDDLAAFLEMNQLLDAVLLAQRKLEINPPRKIYLPPLPTSVELSELDFEKFRYRDFSGSGWMRPEDGRVALQVPMGKVDLVKKCKQEPLVLDFLSSNPHLLLVGSQTDIVMGLQSMLFPLLLSHSPDDVQIHILDFGKGLHNLPAYPHIGNIISEHESERIARTILYFETKIAERETAYLTENHGSDPVFPQLFLIINNIAGLSENINLYKRVIKFISQECSRYGIHVIATALPRGTGTRVPSSDLKIINSRIVFPSINHDDYWHYLDTSERKLVKLTEMDNGTKDPRWIARAHWLCTNDPQFEQPVELQIALPRFLDQTDKEYIVHMNREWNTPPEKIRTLERKYVAKEALVKQSGKENFILGVKWVDLKDLDIPLADLPPIWGVSGSRESGKTNFLTLLVHQYSSFGKNRRIEAFSLYSNQLTDYCKSKGISIELGHDCILERLKQIDVENFDEEIKTLLVFDDINQFWERDSDINKEIVGVLEKLSNKLYRNKNATLVASFNYSGQLKTAKSRDALIREIHNNRTGLCLGYEGDWLISSTDLLNYKKNLNGAIPAGRGVFVLKGKETELQTYCYEAK